MRLDAKLSSLDLLSSLSVGNAESMLRRKKGVNNMKIKILSLANGLNEILNLHLDRLGFKAETVDYSKPLLPQIEEADILINGLGQVDRSIIDGCHKLRMVQQVGTGIDNVDVDYCTSRSIYVTNVPKANSVAVAEHTLFLMIYMAKSMKSAGRSLMQRRVLNVLGSELQGKTLLLIGLGYIGSEVAKRANAFGMKVVAVTKHPNKKGFITSVDNNSIGRHERSYDFLDHLTGPNNLSRHLSDVDYVSLHTNLTNETRGMIGVEEFKLMKRTAFLINVARASIVDRDALYTALQSGTIAGAAFDVFWEEPANPRDRLLQLDNFVLMPHIAGWTRESANVAADVITKNIEEVAQGNTPLTAVNSF
jgi:D-3-phosphoglycerate dehydrogenase / 2-oxoglutarate reductase